MKINFDRIDNMNCNRIREIDASQFIGKAWREINGSRKLIEINYFDPDFPLGFENHLSALKETIQNSGVEIGAFGNNALIAFISVNREIFSKKQKYVLLDQLFVSKEHRGKGIGRQLLERATINAKKWGAKKYYICAGSSEETIAFYFAVGCKEAEEINLSLFEKDVRDYQYFSLHDNPVYCLQIDLEGLL